MSRVLVIVIRCVPNGRAERPLTLIALPVILIFGVWLRAASS